MSSVSQKKKNDAAEAAATTTSTSTTNTAAAAAANVKGCKSVMDFLHTSLPRSSLLDLYEEQSSGQYVCQAVFQRLPEISQQIVIRLMCTGNGKFPLSMVKLWLKPPTTTPSSSSTSKSTTTTTTSAATSATIKLHKILSRQLEELYRWAIIERNVCEGGKEGGGGRDGKGTNDLSNNDDSTMTTNNKSLEVELTPQFMKGYRKSLESLDMSPWRPMTEPDMESLEASLNLQLRKAAMKNGEAPPTTYQKFPKLSLEQLEEHTQAQWDIVLHFLVGSDQSVAPAKSVESFLLETNLMQYDPDYRGRDPELYAPLVITTHGYDFMLQDNSQQVWHFVLRYLTQLSASNGPEIQREALLFLISLSCCRLGDCFSSANLSKTGRVIAKDLSNFGLLYWWGRSKTGAFYPTRVALQLVGGNNGPSSSSSKNKGGGGGGGVYSWSTKTLDSALAHPHPNDSSHLAIIVQTNFQVCAYTTSDLHVNMLGLFCDLTTIRRLPNVVMMSISRDSIKLAFALGIKAQQILRFLEKHAHPKLREGTASPIPQNIIDQIFLWDQEQNRVKWDEVYVHKATMEGEFEYVVQLAKSRGLYAYSNNSKRVVMVKHRGAKFMEKKIRDWRARKAAGM